MGHTTVAGPKFAQTAAPFLLQKLGTIGVRPLRNRSGLMRERRTKLVVLPQEALQQLLQMVHAAPLVRQLAGVGHHLPPTAHPTGLGRPTEAPTAIDTFQP